jgi:hypothetical protein
MNKKENTKLINLLFEVYKKGVKGEECNLDDSLKEMLAAINYTHCCTKLKSKQNRVIPKVKSLDRLNLNDEVR